MSRAPNESELRHLLSKAWSPRRRKPDTPIVRNALHLDLNRELEEKRGRDGIKYFLAIVILQGLLYFVWSWIGLG